MVKDVVAQVILVDRRDENSNRIPGKISQRFSSHQGKILL
jgi:hypothetical protein